MRRAFPYPVPQTEVSAFSALQEPRAFPRGTQPEQGAETNGVRVSAVSRLPLSLHRSPSIAGLGFSPEIHPRPQCPLPPCPGVQLPGARSWLVTHSTGTYAVPAARQGPRVKGRPVAYPSLSSMQKTGQAYGRGSKSFLQKAGPERGPKGPEVLSHLGGSEQWSRGRPKPRDHRVGTDLGPAYVSMARSPS